MGIEFELKYRADAGKCRALLEAYPGNWQQITMETTYYDTPAGELAAKRCTLRRRSENGKSVCTVKTPGENGVRGEWETECGDIREAVEILCKLGGPEELLSSRDGLVPVCGARFIRQCRVFSQESCTVELAADNGVLLGGGQEVPLCEIEVELKSGSPEAAVAFARKLAARFGLQEEKKSKFRRALDLAKGV